MRVGAGPSGKLAGASRAVRQESRLVFPVSRVAFRSPPVGALVQERRTPHGSLPETSKAKAQVLLRC